MPSSRRKTSAVLRDFLVEIKRLENFDAKNQKNFSSKIRSLSKYQLHQLTEYIFFVGFREFECFIRDMFLLFCLEKEHSSKRKARSYLRPKDFSHAELLVQSSMPHLDWTSPDTVIDRANTYLVDGFPFILPYQTHLQALRDFKKIRNHIAHQSKESYQDYLKVMKRHYGVIPLSIPSPGEFLLLTDQNDPTKYKLLIFFDLLKQIASDIT